MARQRSPPQDHLAHGCIRRIRVIIVPSRAHASTGGLHKYLASLDMTTFDPGKWHWHEGGPLFSYTAKLGRQWRHPRQLLSLHISVKWQGMVPVNFQPNWQELWQVARPRNEAAFCGASSTKQLPSITGDINHIRPHRQSVHVAPCRSLRR